MNNLPFFKYQGTGNDFIMIDDRTNSFPIENNLLIKQLCNRNFGIGADGLILLQNDKMADFKMVYFNSDGNQSTMCGNGGRCLVAFAKDLGIIDYQTQFSAIDGIHKAEINNEIVKLKMNDVSLIENHSTHFFLNTGSPHHVEFLDNIDDINIQEIGSKIRYGSPYFEEGTNVNFVEIVDDQTIKIRTYERGVEGETLSCGTGVTAAAIAFHYSNQINATTIHVTAMGGELKVCFETDGQKNYREIYLIGSAKKVFTGKIDL